MKVDLRIYLAKNFGDDLFLEIISNRYKDIEFIAYPTLRYNKDEVNSNVTMKNNMFIRKYNYICNKLRLYKLNTNRFLIKKCDATIIIGGSIFQEGAKWHYFKKRLDLFCNLNKNYYILSCNFGPYHSQEFFDIHKNIIELSQDTCFRDVKSYKLFEELPNVRCAPDLAFSLDTSDYQVRNDNKAIISVIDLSWRNNLNKYTEIYDKKMVEITDYFVNKGYEVVLTSFSKFEGDENAIKRIMKLLPEKNKRNVRTHFYNGNIKETINEIATCKTIIASRFHANILGLLFNKNIIPIIYSNKTANLLEDVKFEGVNSTIENINNLKVNFSEKDLNYKADVTKITKLSNREFVKLDKLLKKG